MEILVMETLVIIVYATFEILTESRGFVIEFSIDHD